MKFFRREFHSKMITNVREVISHLTDVEGNLGYMQRWADRSKYLQLRNGALSFKVPVKDMRQTFVYGGDFTDKGPGDLRIGKALTEFKKSNPNHVFLIAGNREIKCRRFTYELDPNHIRQRLLLGQPAFWRKQIAPKDYVSQRMLHDKWVMTSDKDIEKYISRLSTEQCQTLYLQWMLNETMGCGPFGNKPSTFEYRRLELAELSGKVPEEISDEEVTQSFIDSVAPNGIITRYLKQAQLGVIQGETLFIHGAVTLQNQGYVPGLSDTGYRIPDAKEWIDTLNRWYSEQITQWDSHRFESDIQPPGHKPLDQYVVYNPKSIVTTNWYQNNKLSPIPKAVIDYLNRAGIYRVVTGHQPFSDFPLIIRDPSLEVIVGDTGYSDPDAPTDNRGNAIHNLEVFSSEKQTHVAINAIRKDGSVLKLELPDREKIHTSQDIEIGYFTANERLIRPAYNRGLVGSQLDGFTVQDEAIAVNERAPGTS
jgi:hypothetical protein